MKKRIGRKGKHNRRRKASRHGRETSPVVLSRREGRVSRPRARTVECREVVLESYEAVKGD